MFWLISDAVCTMSHILPRVTLNDSLTGWEYGYKLTQAFVVVTSQTILSSIRQSEAFPYVFISPTSSQFGRPQKCEQTFIFRIGARNLRGNHGRLSFDYLNLRRTQNASSHARYKMKNIVLYEFHHVFHVIVFLSSALYHFSK